MPHIAGRSHEILSFCRYVMSALGTLTVFSDTLQAQFFFLDICIYVQCTSTK